MRDLFTNHSNGLPPLDAQGTLRQRRPADITRWFLRRRHTDDQIAGLRARLKQLYDDLEGLGGAPVGDSVANVYNALICDMTNAAPEDEDELMPFRRVTRDASGESVRLLVGQLRLIARED